MQWIGNRLATSALALLLAVSLTFGVSSALTQVRAPCRYDPPIELGYCSSQEECEATCRGSGAGDFGWCTSDGCCTCYI